MPRDPIPLAAELIGCAEHEIMTAVYKDDGSLVAITTAGAKHKFTAQQLNAIPNSVLKSAATASAVDDISTAAQPAASPPAAGRVATPARPARKRPEVSKSRVVTS